MGSNISKYYNWNLFNIATDPCEYYDVKEEETEIYEKMIEMFETFWSQQAPARFSMFPEDFDTADPSQFDGVWSPWMTRNNIEDGERGDDNDVDGSTQRVFERISIDDDGEKEGEEHVLAVDGTVTTRSQRLS